MVQSFLKVLWSKILKDTWLILTVRELILMPASALFERRKSQIWPLQPISFPAVLKTRIIPTPGVSGLQHLLPAISFFYVLLVEREFRFTSFRSEVSKFFCKGPDNKYFKVCEPSEKWRIVCRYLHNKKENKFLHIFKLMKCILWL